MAETGDGGIGGGRPSNVLFWVATYAALGLSTVSGGYTVSTHTERVSQDTFVAELNSRDIAIRYLEQQYQELKSQVDRIDSNGPAVGNKDFDRRIHRLEAGYDKLRDGDS